MLKRKMSQTLSVMMTGLALVASLFLSATAHAAPGIQSVTPQLTVSVQSDAAVNLQWSIPSGVRISGFEIERSMEPLSGYALAFTSGKGSWSSTDQNVQPGQSYYYRVRAVKNGKTNEYSAYSNIEMAEIAAPVPVDSTPPSVSLTNPASNTTFNTEQTVNLVADATDDISVDRVDFFCDDILVGSDATAPYSYGWAISQAQNGQRILKAKAYDKAGKEGVSLTKSVTVNIAPQTTPVPGTFEFAAASSSVNEGAGSINVVIKRVGGSDGAVTVDWRTRGVTATFGEDYSDFSWTTLSFAHGETQKVMSISIVDDSAIEGNEDFNVLLGNPTGGASLGAVTTNVVTIVDNDQAVPVPGSFEFAVANSSVSEGSGSVYIVIKRVGGSDGAVTVDWRTSSVSATYGEDYGNFSWTTLSFAHGETQKVQSISIVDDNLIEGNEVFNVMLGNPTGGASLGAITTNAVTITDNDQAVLAPGSFEFAVASSSVNEGDGSINAVIKRVGGSDGAVTVDWRTRGVTATFGEDYGDFSWTTLSFAHGETQKVQSISVVDDNLFEGDEVFNVLLGNPTGGASLGAITTNAVTITDNDESTQNPSPNPDPSGPARAFPGAEGFGTETPAGRGGTIIKVTNLNDSGSGSLRAAIEASGPRIVVFEVGGIINLSTHLKISNPDITIAGQTAPFPGITLKNAGMIIKASNVLIQHLSARPGDSSSGPDPDNRDAFQILGPSTSNVVLDHISASWAIDENVSTWYELHDVTISNSIISEALYSSTHSNGPHSMGLLVGDFSTNVSLIGNLVAHNRERNPRIKGAASALVVNNLFYNSGSAEFMGFGSSDGPTTVSAVGNVFLDGPNALSTSFPFYISSSTVAGSKLYVNDNIARNNIVKNGSTINPVVTSAPIWTSPLTVRNSSTVEGWVLSNAGSRPAERNAVDARVVSEVASRSGYIIDSQNDVGGYPNMSSTSRSFSIPANPHGDDDGDGYTNIEEVLHQMAAQVEGR